MAYTSETRAMLVAQIADATGLDLTLEAYAPGDGWTRYRLAEVQDRGAISTAAFGNRFYKASEIDAFLYGAAQAVHATLRNEARRAERRAG